jgi:hypothetical protein
MSCCEKKKIFFLQKTRKIALVGTEKENFRSLEEKKTVGGTVGFGSFPTRKITVSKGKKTNFRGCKI